MNKNKFHFVNALWLIYLSLNISTAESQVVSFERTYQLGERSVGYDVQIANDGGYVVAGESYVGAFDSVDIFLMKIDSNGAHVFTKTFGGGDFERGNSLDKTFDGGYIITGITNSFGSGDFDVYLVKTDANGNSMWTKTYGGLGDETGHSVQQTSDSGYIIVGTNENTPGTNNIYLIRTDAIGDTVWTRTFSPGAHQFAYSARQTYDDGFIIIGSTTNFGAASWDVYLLKIDVNGAIEWSKNLGADSDYGYSVEQTVDSGFIISGMKSQTGISAYIIKTNQVGDTIWTKVLGDLGCESGEDIAQTKDGGYIMTGFSNDTTSQVDLYLVKMDSIGDTLWTKTFGTGIDEIGWSVKQTTDGGYIIAGQASDAFATKVYLIKTDVLGHVTSVFNLPIPQRHLIQVYPNPFSANTTIVINAPLLKRTSTVNLILYDILGREVSFGNGDVQSLQNEMYKFHIERGSLPSGLYLFTILEDGIKVGQGKLMIE